VEFNGDDRFLPINYAKDWAVVRDVAEKSGMPYNRNAYDAEAKREADAAARKAADGVAKQQGAPR
jgi:phosphonate transport system substrate-binding protein